MRADKHAGFRDTFVVWVKKRWIPTVGNGLECPLGSGAAMDIDGLQGTPGGSSNPNFQPSYI